MKDQTEIGENVPRGQETDPETAPAPIVVKANVSPEEFAELQARAAESGRSLWVEQEGAPPTVKVIDRRAASQMIPVGGPIRVGDQVAIRDGKAVADRPPTPMDLYHMAASAKDPDLDRLERLLAMQVAWEDREAEKAFSRALAAFKLECPTLPRNKHVCFLSVNYWYTEFWVADKIAGPAMSRNGLSITWEPIEKEGKIGVRSTLQHVDGFKRVIEDFGKPDEQKGNMKDGQRRQSTRTTLARQLYFSHLGLTSGAPDTDGNFDEGGDGETLERETGPNSPPSKPQPPQDQPEGSANLLAKFERIGVLQADLEGDSVGVGRPRAEWTTEDMAALVKLGKEIMGKSAADRRVWVGEKCGGGNG